MLDVQDNQRCEAWLYAFNNSYRQALEAVNVISTLFVPTTLIKRETSMSDLQRVDIEWDRGMLEEMVRHRFRRALGGPAVAPKEFFEDGAYEHWLESSQENPSRLIYLWNRAYHHLNATRNGLPPEKITVESIDHANR